MENRKGGSSAFWWLAGGFGAGAVVGLLYAPKSGVETREDLMDWGRRSRERSRGLLSRINEAIPFRVKAGAAVGAVKGGAKAAI